jgi:hypothetical protein
VACFKSILQQHSREGDRSDAFGKHKQQLPASGASCFSVVWLAQPLSACAVLSSCHVHTIS